MASPPIKKIALGYMAASIWRQDTDNGPMYNTTFARSFKRGNKWEESSSFGSGELGTLSVLAIAAAHWIIGQVARDRERRPDNGGNGNGTDNTHRTNPQVDNNRGGNRGGPARNTPRGGGDQGHADNAPYTDTGDDYPPY